MRISDEMRKEAEMRLEEMRKDNLNNPFRRKRQIEIDREEMWINKFSGNIVGWLEAFIGPIFLLFGLALLGLLALVCASSISFG